MNETKNRKIIFSVLMILLITYNTLFTQQMNSARGIGIAAFSTLTRDINSIDWNPAGLINIKDWEINFSNYLPTGRNFGFTFNSFGIGKKFLNNQAVAVCYSPGKLLEFNVPSTIIIYDSLGNRISAKYDKQISYSQSFSMGLSYLVHKDFSIGLSTRLFETKISDNKYYFDTNYVIQSQTLNYTPNLWSIDAGILYQLEEDWLFGIIFKNLLDYGNENTSNDLKEYYLDISKTIRFNTAYKAAKNLRISTEFDTEKGFRSGAEWSPVNWLQFRSGVYANNFPNLTFEAGALGLGITYKFLQTDISFIKFIANSNRTGTIDINAFKKASYVDIDYTPFTSDRLSFSININLGKEKETLARIEYVEMLSEIFPASYQIYAFRPVGKARVKNISSKSINAKVSFYIEGIMNSPTVTKPIAINPNELLEIPFYAVFNENVNAIKKFTIFDGTIYVHAEIASDYDDSYQTRVYVRGRNDWNGDISSLKYFVTPDEPHVLQFTRESLNQNKEQLDTIPELLQKFEKAKIIFNEFTKRMSYIHDPQKSRDFVQYPSETLSLHGGDCDDLTVCYSSLLMSIGISTAFVDVIPPDNPQDAHVYMLFDTGIEAKDAQYISDNPKRYVVRKNNKNTESVWIPIETTVTSKRFDEAWNVGAEKYYNDAVVKLGILKGWMRVFDLESVF